MHLNTWPSEAELIETRWHMSIHGLAARKERQRIHRLDVNNTGVFNDFLLHKAWGPNL